MTPTELRLRLLHAGYDPLPLFGKAPSMLKDWQHKTNTNDQDVEMWAKQWPDARNTGILCQRVPTFDIDVMHPAAQAVEELVRAHYEEAGPILVRFGQPPKRAIPFRTDEPFKKILVNLTGPEGGQHKLEFLGEGQQVVVAGIHPGTGKPYSWHGGELSETRRADLPYIRGGEAHQFVEKAVDVLDQHGFRRAEGDKKADDHDHTSADWDALIGNLIEGVALHDSLRDLAASCVAKGFRDGDAIELLRSLMRKSRAERDTRWLERYNEIPRIVRSAHEKFGAGAAQQFNSPWHWQNEADPMDTRRHLVESLLPETGTALISGQWGTYKTFVADDLAASVMTGTPFINFPVLRKGGVLWFACEGQSEVAIRITAAWEAKGGNGRAPFAWIDNCPRLLDPNAANALAAVIKPAAEKMQQDFSLPVALVIIDTVGKAAGALKAGELNDDVVVKAIMKGLATLSIDLNALVLAVAHFGKNIETGTKGSSSFEDDADVVLALLGDKSVNGIVEEPRLCARKRRGGPSGEEFPFRTQVVDLGSDKNGCPVTTLTLRWPDPAMIAAPKPKAQKNPWRAKPLRLLYRSLTNLPAECWSDQLPFLDGPTVRATSLETVRAEFYKSYSAEGDPKAKQQARRQAFHRATTDAQANGLIGIREIDAVIYIWIATPPPEQPDLADVLGSSKRWADRF
jgi:hypothetical protein